MADVFICHVHRDGRDARDLASALEAKGYSTWYYERDSDAAGASYLQMTTEAIHGSQALILIVSPGAFAYPLQVHGEVVEAYEEGKHIIPILVDVSWEDLRARQPEWKRMIADATGIELGRRDVADIVPALTRGLTRLDIRPNGATRSGAGDATRSRAGDATADGAGGADTRVAPDRRRGRRRSRREHRTLVIAAVAAVVLLVGALSAFLTTRGSSGGADVQRYLTKVDSLLQDSASDKNALNVAVTAVNNGDLSGVDRIADIEQSRSAAAQRVNTWTVPSGVEHVNTLLVATFDASAQADHMWLAWAKAVADGDDVTAHRIVAQAREFQDSKVHPAKDAFLGEYNRLRQQGGQNPLPLDFSF
jgi:hypothetical protein